MSRSDVENNSLRAGFSVRSKLGIECGSQVVLFRDGSSTPIKTFTLRQAYRDDLVTPKGKTACFVTARNFDFFGGSKHKHHIVLEDSLLILGLGADPEFAFVDKQGSLCNAGALKTGGLPFGYDSTLGSDGRLAELRPLPASSPRELCQNIGNVIKEYAKAGDLSNLFWRAGAYFSDPKGSSCMSGGHIHIDYPAWVKALLTKAREAGNIGGGVDIRLIKVFVKVLDYYLGELLVNIDDPQAPNRKKSYGKFGAYRPQNGRFEWRVPSGMWLVDKSYAEGVLGLAQAIAATIYSKMEKGAPKTIDGVTNAWTDQVMVDVFDLSNTKLNQTLERINNHIPLTSKQLASHLKELGGFIKNDRFVGLLDKFLKMDTKQIATLQKKDLREIWA